MELFLLESVIIDYREQPEKIELHRVNVNNFVIDITTTTHDFKSLLFYTIKVIPNYSILWN